MVSKEAIIRPQMAYRRFRTRRANPGSLGSWHALRAAMRTAERMQDDFLSPFELNKKVL